METLKIRNLVTIKQETLVTGLAEIFGAYILYNEGKITKIVDGRVEVKWPSNQKFYFNPEQLQKA